MLHRLTETIHADVRITLRHRQSLMPEEVCYVLQRYTLSPETCRKSVTKVVPVKISNTR